MKRKVLALVFLLLIVIVSLVMLQREAKAPDSSTQTLEPSSSQTADFDKKQHSLEEPASLWVVVNKKRSLPANYVPENLVKIGGNEQLRGRAASDLNNLLGAAKSAGINLTVLSGYRSYARQVSVYNSYVAKDTQAEADNYSARPGHSEHQTGLAVDLGNGICDLEICFGNTAAGRWLTDSAYMYGFIIRYAKGKESITGYQFEPWHLRYVGKDLAAELKKTNLSLEEFFGLPAAPTY